MTDALLAQRIEQWEHMTREDPENAMGWFSLGNAYKQAERTEDAAQALRKSIELDAGLSRAYQTLGQILIAEGANDPARDVLTRGYTVAAERGDVMPQRAMGKLLEKIGAPVPQVKSAAPEPVAGNAQTIIDRRTNQPGTRLDKPPMRGPIGQFIQDNFSKETWRAWIGQGTKVINELRLDFSRLDHQDMYDQSMMEWLGFTKEEAEHHAAEQQQQQQQ